jgi:group I intron endonuclease
MYMRPRPRTRYAGVYAIRHVQSGRRYIGGSTDMTGRWTYHRFTLRRGMHKTAALQALWTADGEDAFVFEVLEKCSPVEVLQREQAWLDATPDRLNTSASAITGHTAGPSDAKKAAAKKRWARPEYRAKQAATAAKKKNPKQLSLFDLL